jgi:hypothetical protein
MPRWGQILAVLGAVFLLQSLFGGQGMGSAFWSPWGGIALIICSVALLNYVKGQNKQGGGNKKIRELENRLAEMERRMNDVQDIVLSIDERFEYKEKLRS